jgi:hypothetical protein
MIPDLPVFGLRGRKSTPLFCSKKSLSFGEKDNAAFGEKYNAVL